MNYFRLPVEDVRRSAAFYEALLGVSATLPSEGDYAEVETPEILLALYGPDFDSYDRRTPQLDRPCVSLRLPPMPITHVHQVLRDHGLRVRHHHPPFLDPDGHTIHWTPSVVQEVAP